MLRDGRRERTKRQPYEFRPAWRHTLEEAGINRLRFHDLRHEAVSRLVERLDQLMG